MILPQTITIIIMIYKKIKFPINFIFIKEFLNEKKKSIGKEHKEKNLKKIIKFYFSLK
jgi:hypothetical protein